MWMEHFAMPWSLALVPIHEWGGSMGPNGWMASRTPTQLRKKVCPCSASAVHFVFGWTCRSRYAFFLKYGFYSYRGNRLTLGFFATKHFRKRLRSILPFMASQRFKTNASVYGVWTVWCVTLLFMALPPLNFGCQFFCEKNKKHPCVKTSVCTNFCVRRLCVKTSVCKNVCV